MIKTAQFVKSAPDLKGCPSGDLPEFAFIGRSNVGKSSLINMLTNHSKLAKTSGKPGKTQLLNYFIINDSWHLVDMPGFGYASTSKEKRKQFGILIQNYLSKRELLACAFLLIDSRIPPQKIDQEFMEWCGMNQVPFVIVFTKIDKLSSSVLNKNLLAYKKAMMQQWDELPKIFISSSVTKTGKEELINFIDHTVEAIRLNNSK